MAKVLMTPIAIVGGLIAGLIAQKVFDFVWGRLSDEEAPKPDQRAVPLPALLAALIVEGAIFRVAKGLVDRGTRRGFERVTGTWPGEERPDPT